MFNLLVMVFKKDNNIGLVEILWVHLGGKMDSFESLCMEIILVFRIIVTLLVQQDDNIKLKKYQLILFKIFLILCPILLLSSFIVCIFLSASSSYSFNCLENDTRVF
jgi:hypothetical protein